MTSRRPHFEVDVVGPELHIVDDEISDDFDADAEAAAAEKQKSFGRELYDTAVRSGKSSLKLVVRYAPYVVAMLALYALISHKIESDRRNRLAFNADLAVQTRLKKSSVKRAWRKYDRQTGGSTGRADDAAAGTVVDDDRSRFDTSSSQNRGSSRASRRADLE